MSNYADRETDKELAKLEKRITKVYAEAAKDLGSTITDYFAAFADRDAEMQQMVDDGKITKEHYKQWRLNQMGRGKRYEALRDKVAQRVTDANEVAIAYTNDATPGIYSLNRNYAAYAIEQATGSTDFALWDEQTVRRLIVERPDLMPYYPKERALKRGIDLAYGKRQITNVLTSSILQGKSIKGIADDLQTHIPDMGRSSAVRTARTAVTGAQNAGRMDSYNAAKKMGIKLKKHWVSTLDGRTRHSHRMLDGESVDVNDTFSNGCRFPGDPQGAPWEVYNCRCTLVADIPGVDMSSATRRARNPETGRNEVVQYQTYQEWAKGKKLAGEKPAAKPVAKTSEMKQIMSELEANNVEYKAVEKRTEQLTDDEIIDIIGGGDRTSGSCVSAAFAYVGQQLGYNVRDFRGGESLNYFRDAQNIYGKVFKLPGMNAVFEQAKGSIAIGNKLLKQTQPGKKYYLCVGRHAAIVRRTQDGVLQYLELQSDGRYVPNGWTNFNGNPRYTLAQRFGCENSKGFMRTGCLVDLDNFENVDDFPTLIGYINTAVDKQMKGSGGSVK